LRRLHRRAYQLVEGKPSAEQLFPILLVVPHIERFGDAAEVAAVDGTRVIDYLQRPDPPSSLSWRMTPVPGMEMASRSISGCGWFTLPARAVMGIPVASEGLRIASVISAFSGIFVSRGPRLPR
jgi:hypothetical protein